MLKLTKTQMRKLYHKNKIFIWSYKTLYGIGYSQAQNQYYLTKNLTVTEPKTKRGKFIILEEEKNTNEQ